MKKSNRTFYEKYGKRTLDITLSIIAIIVLSPVFIVVAILVRINLGKPILFKQSRPGLNENKFTMYKFKSMKDTKDEEGNLLSDKLRLTKFGKKLRSTSLDEIPGIFNILKGDMSIIGPRPLATIYLPYYNEKEKLRHTVRPGLTGLAQVNGRNMVNWEERFSFDITYVKNIKFSSDIKIFIKTITTVLKKEDVAVRGSTNIISFHIYRQKQIDKERRL